MNLGIALALVATVAVLMAGYSLYLDAHAWRAVGWREDGE